MNTKLPNLSNYQNGRKSDIKYIVVHYTANNGDTAKGNATYFANNVVRASAHYFVDEKEVWSSVPENDTAWHTGGDLQGPNGHTFHKIVTNSNSIGIELCSRKDIAGEYYIKKETILNAIELIRSLMKKHNIPIENVVRHYDVTGKLCPKPLIDQKKWTEFKGMIRGDMDYEKNLEILREVVGLSEESIKYLTDYKYGEELVKKIARSVVK